MHGLLPQATTLRRVTLHGAQRDSLRARHRLEQALTAVDWTPAGLPPQAVLLVKRLAPAKREGGATSASASFAQRVAMALNDCAGKARRPWLHADAVTAEAVVFTDEAEMVACLVRDWLGGVAAQRWWWRSVLGDAVPASWLRRQVLARGEVLVPAAVRLMEGAGSPTHAATTLEAWFARLEDGEAQEATVSVERAFALASPPVRPTMVRERQVTGAPAAVTDESAEPLLGPADEVALQRLLLTVPELRACALRTPQRRLFALVLAVVRSPSWARTPQLALALSLVEHAAAQAEVIDDEAAAVPDDIDSSNAGDPGAREADVPSRIPARERKPLHRHRERPTARTQPRGESAVDESSAIRAVAPDEGHSPSTTANDPLTENLAPPDAAATVPDAEPHRARNVSPPAHPVPAEVHTAFGGIFYLLNAALALGLYGDFTMPRARGLALSPWDWLALAGKSWFGPAFVRDPVWPLLAALAGRSKRQAPGRDFDVPASWAIDPSWLLPWGPIKTLSVHATRSRLCVHHPAGFVVFDVPRDPSIRPLAQAQALCAPHAVLRNAKLAPARLEGRALPRPGVARWLRWMLGYLDARLALTLGAQAGDDVPSLVCRHAARISIGAGDVDVSLQLADLPLPIRLAGLDRDPGWIPAAGRGVKFRFS